MLQSLYKFRAPSGDKVNPEDIMVIAPYRGSGTWSKIPSVISAWYGKMSTSSMQCRVKKLR